jgi:multiple sugar transport system substrate-binding protein
MATMLRPRLKKLLSFFLLSATLLAACSPAATAAPTSAPQNTAVPATPVPATSAPAATATTAAQSVELTVWQVPNSPEMQKIVEDQVKPFEQSEGIKVNVVIIPWGDLDTMWASAIQSAETPSFGYMYDFRLPTHYRSGALEPLDQYFTDEELDKFLEQPLQTAYYQGQLYAIPMVVSSDHLIYNKKAFAEAGITPPDDPMYSPTWEEFLDWSKKLKAAGFGSFEYGFRSVWNHPMDDWYYRFGCRETNDDHTKMTFDTPECRKAVQAWVDLAPTLSDKAKSTAWSPFDEFFAGTNGMAEGGAFITKQLTTSYPDIEFGMMLPFHDKEEKAYLGIGYYAVFADAKNKPEVIKLLKFLVSQDQQVVFNTAIGTFPAVKGSRELMFPDATGQLKESLDLTWHLLDSGTAKFLYPWPGFSRFADETFIPNWQSLMLGNLSVDDFIKVIQEEGQKAIDAGE